MASTTVDAFAAKWSASSGQSAATRIAFLLELCGGWTCLVHRHGLRLKGAKVNEVGTALELLRRFGPIGDVWERRRRALEGAWLKSKTMW